MFEGKLRIYFMLYILLLSVSLGAMFLKSPDKVLKLHVTMRAPGCDYAEVFFNSEPVINLESRNTQRVFLNRTDEFVSYDFSLIAPVKYLRFDFCDNRHDVVIKSITGKFETQKFVIPLDKAALWGCYNCAFEKGAATLTMRSYTNDPIALATNVDEYIGKFGAVSGVKIEIVGLVAFLFLLSLPLLLYVTHVKAYMFAVAVQFLMFVGLYVLARFFHKFSVHLPPSYPPVVDRVVGYVHYVGYNTLMDSIPLAVVVGIPVFGFLIVKLLKRIR